MSAMMAIGATAAMVMAADPGSWIAYSLGSARDGSLSYNAVLTADRALPAMVEHGGKPELAFWCRPSGLSATLSWSYLGRRGFKMKHVAVTWQVDERPARTIDVIANERDVVLSGDASRALARAIAVVKRLTVAVGNDGQQTAFTLEGAAAVVAAMRETGCLG